MGGGQYADVYRFLPLSADRPNRLLLNDAEKFDLHGERQVGDFIEKQRPACRALQQAGLIVHGTGEGAFPVSEELTLHQLRRDGSAVHGDEWSVYARAGVVNHACNQLFAGS